jgi:polysaccharide export outer membrane protein
MLLGAAPVASAQVDLRVEKKLERRGPEEGAKPLAATVGAATPGAKAAPKEAPADYVLGADDQISLWTPEAEELNNKSLRVEGNGTVTIPLIGTMQAAGMNTTQLAAEISKRLEKYYVKPHVVVSVSDYKSQPVSLIGAVNTPGVHQVQGRKTLVEMISMAGGLRQDAGPVAVLTRQSDQGPIPVQGATMDASGKFSTAQIDLRAVLDAQRPEENIAIKPNDVISVPKAKLVYVLGEVERSGGYPLTDGDGVSVIKALSMAGGMKSMAAPQNARILRDDQSGPKEGKPVDVKALLSGKERDFDLEPGDVLWIPDSKPKKALTRAAEAAIQTLTGVAIWRVGSQH